MSRRLSSYNTLKVTAADSLENLRKELSLENVNTRMNRAVQTAIRDSLGVDYIISGSLEKN